MKTLRFLSYYQGTVRLDKVDHITPFLDIALIPRDLPSHVLISKKNVLHLCNMIRKTASVTQMFQPGTFHREDAAKEMCGHGEEMSYQDTADVYFVEEKLS